MSEYKMEITPQDCKGMTASYKCELAAGVYGLSTDMARERTGMARGLHAARNAYPRNVLAFLAECGVKAETMEEARALVVNQSMPIGNTPSIEGLLFKAWKVSERQRTEMMHQIANLKGALAALEARL